MPKLSPKLPLVIDSIDGAYKSIDNYRDLVKQHVKMLVLTSPGERIMDPNYGVGVRRFLFQQNTIHIRSELTATISQQFSIYLPYLQLEDVLFRPATDNQNAFVVKIIYTIIPLNITQEQDVPVMQPGF